MDRRDFLKRNLQLIALGLMPGNFLSSCTTHKTIRLGALLATSHALAQDGKGTVFSLYDLDRDSLKELPLSLETGHTAIVHPKRKNILFVPESAGDKACVIDLDQWRVIREVRANPGRVFGGHGDFNQDGSLLYVSEFEPPPSGKGFLTVLNGSDFTKIRSMPSRGKYPHDVTLNRNGKILCISKDRKSTRLNSSHT